MDSKKQLAASLMGAVAILSSANTAADDNGIDVDFSGFASVIFGQTITDKDEGQVYDIPTDLTLNDFNKLGLRLDVDLKHNLTFTTQFIAYGRDDYSPKIDWLNVSYNFSPEMTLTAGRSRIPFSFYSDVLDVGYAYVWIDPPKAVYTTEAVRSVDGLSFRYTADISDEWASDLGMWVGNNEQNLAGIDLTFSVKDMVGVSWAVAHQWLTMRVAYSTGRSTLGFDITQRPLNPADPTGSTVGDMFEKLQEALPDQNFNAIINDVNMEEKRIQWLSIGMMMEFDEIFFISEASQQRIDDVLPYGDVDSVYATLGFNLPASLTLALTYSYDSKKADDAAIKNFDKAIVGAPATPEVQGAVFATSAVLDGIKARTGRQQNTFNVTTRWDFHPQADLKFEYMYQERRQINLDQNPQSLRMALDVIF